MKKLHILSQKVELYLRTLQSSPLRKEKKWKFIWSNCESLTLKNVKSCYFNSEILSISYLMLCQWQTSRGNLWWKCWTSASSLWEKCRHSSSSSKVFLHFHFCHSFSWTVKTENQRYCQALNQIKSNLNSNRFDLGWH